MPRPRVLILAFACLLLAVFLSGCAPTITDGIVTQKSFTPAHTTTTYIWHTIGKVQIMQPIPVHHPDSFDIEVRDVESEKREWWNVLPATYDAVCVGDKLHRSTDGTLDITHPPD